MKATIEKQCLKTEYYTPEKCFITELSNSADDPDLSIARARVESGVTTRRHRLKGITERYLMISGQGQVEVDDWPPRDVRPGDVVCIPPSCPQRITNTGSGDLVFLALCTPRFVPQAYEDIDESTVDP